mmetsp:Transcript_5094/g.12207  ORF Transcript_5094/g.12207 Transcript_5094/m.12207 type:complete len:146 (-) Transcript_5094:104-541(-)
MGCSTSLSSTTSGTSASQFASSSGYERFRSLVPQHFSAQRVIFQGSYKKGSWTKREKPEPSGLIDFHSGTCTPMLKQHHWVHGQVLPPDMDMTEERGQRLQGFLRNVAQKPKLLERRIYSLRARMEQELLVQEAAPHPLTTKVSL